MKVARTKAKKTLVLAAALAVGPGRLVLWHGSPLRTRANQTSNSS